VSIWTDAGVLLASQNVSSVPGTWVETPLTTLLQLNAGSTYRVAFYTAGTTYYERLDATSLFANGTINQSYETAGDAFPTFADNVRWWFVDLRYSVGTLGALPVNPAVSAAFSNGVWNGSLKVLTTAAVAILHADDGNGHVGASSPFSVLLATPPIIQVQPLGQTVLGGTNVTFTVSAISPVPLSYSWLKDGSPLPGQTNPLLNLFAVVRTNSGSYSAVITNIAGSTNSTNAALLVHVPQLLGLPLWLPDGTLTFTSADLGGGTITAGDLAGLTAQASTNLTDWIDLPGALTLTNGTLQLQDTGLTNMPVRFYRIIENW
jgi:Immunoglobulin domain